LAKIEEAIALAYKRKAQVLAHTNGDAAIDLLIKAHVKAGRPRDRHTTPVHLQFVRKDQLVSYSDYGFTSSFFTNHYILWTSVNRVSRSGAVIGEAECRTPLQGLKEIKVLESIKEGKTVYKAGK